MKLPKKIHTLLCGCSACASREVPEQYCKPFLPWFGAGLIAALCLVTILALVN